LGTTSTLRQMAEQDHNPTIIQVYILSCHQYLPKYFCTKIPKPAKTPNEIRFFDLTNTGTARTRWIRVPYRAIPVASDIKNFLNCFDPSVFDTTSPGGRAVKLTSGWRRSSGISPLRGSLRAAPIA
jgi:hypothetical protein